MEESAYLTAAEAAARLGISLRTVRRRIADGSLPSVRIGGAVRIPVSALPQAEERPAAAREAVAAYSRSESTEAYIARYNREHWPYTYDRMLARRRAAFAELARLAKLTNPPTGPHDTVDGLLNQAREEFGARLLQFIPEAPKNDQ